MPTERKTSIQFFVIVYQAVTTKQNKNKEETDR